MRNYRNKAEISRDLKLLKLKRDINLEELKIVKHQYKDDLSIHNWLQTAFKYLGKIGIYKIVKTLVK